MRLRSFTAATVTEAMRLVRAELGEEAIIVSTRDGAGANGVQVTAAVEESDPALEDALLFDGLDDDEPPDPALASPLERAAAVVREALLFHGVPRRLATNLAAAANEFAADVPDDREPGRATVTALAAALDERFSFAPLPTGDFDRPIMLVGPPGAGKTVAVAKLAARARLKGQTAGVISTDTARAGGVEQLAAFTRLLEFDICTAEDPPALADAVAACAGCDVILIDTAAANPFDAEEMERLRSYVDAAGADTALVLPAGGEPLEWGEVGEFFAEIGARRLLPTRLDAARRLGGLLTAAEVGRLAFADAGIAARIADGLSPITPNGLARLLLREFVEQIDPSEFSKPENR